ncbi:MAG: hypothetical protein MJE77_10655 [Proteobacteria bacterium]|nr:hypothetical protein [Pseudomonadota bacterium]
MPALVPSQDDTIHDRQVSLAGMLRPDEVRGASSSDPDGSQTHGEDAITGRGLIDTIDTESGRAQREDAVTDSGLNDTIDTENGRAQREDSITDTDSVDAIPDDLDDARTRVDFAPHLDDATVHDRIIPVDPDVTLLDRPVLAPPSAMASAARDREDQPAPLIPSLAGASTIAPADQSDRSHEKLSDSPLVQPRHAEPRSVSGSTDLATTSNTIATTATIPVAASRRSPSRRSPGRHVNHLNTYPEAPPEWAKRPSPWARASSALSGVNDGPFYENKAVLVGGLGAALAAGLIILIIAWVSPGGQADSSEAAQSETAIRGRTLYEQGDFGQAIAFLENQNITEDGGAQLILGHAHAAEGRPGDALSRYLRAVSLDPALASDERLIVNLRAAFDRSVREQVDAAIEVAQAALSSREPVSEQARDMRDLVVDLASHHTDYHTRHRAFDLAKKLGFDSRIERLASFLLDLRQGRRCKDRRQAVILLRALRDKRAIAALRQAADGRGMARRAKGRNTCLRKTALQAAEELDSLPDPGPARPDQQ